MRGIERAHAERPEEIVQLVAFAIGSGEYALDIMRIKEIIHPVPVTAVPKTPAFIEGVIELRGSILPVVDLRKRFDLPAPPPTRASKYIISSIDIGGSRMIVGLMVDGVSEPLRIGRDQVRPAPVLAQGETAYFTGVVQAERTRPSAGSAMRPGWKGRILMLLDVDALLSTREKVSLAHLAAPAERES